VPEIRFTKAERAEVDLVMTELDPETHEFLFDFSLVCPEEDWQFLVGYARREMRAALELGLLARATSQVATELGATDDAGARAYLGSIAWLRNFGRADDADERFLELCGEPGTDSPLFVAVESLLELAQDRMFGTIDEEYRALLEQA
jgi:hypothetical protein